MENANKNLKIIFLPVYRWFFILCGLISLAVCILITVLGIKFSNEPFSSAEFFFLTLGYIFSIFLITKPFFPTAQGLSEMEIKDSLLSMTIYDKEKTRHDLKISLQDIELFKVRIDNDNLAYEAKPSHVNLTINCKDGQKYNFSYDVKFYYKIQQLVSVARFFPNFVYEVNAKLDVIEKMLLNYAKTGKDIGFINMLCLIFESKDIPKTNKIFIGLIILYLIVKIISTIYHLYLLS